MFEGKLARRYIGVQKRHSALTVCSIAIALALITMLFCIFSTVIGTLRNIAYDQGAYHVMVGFDSKEKYDAFAKAISDNASCTLKEYAYPSGTEYFAKVLFNGYIGTDAELFISSVCDKIGIRYLGGRCYKNETLLLYDMIDTRSAFLMVVIVALFYVFVLFLIMMLRLVIDTAFEISSKERERQFGVLQSIGATPRQIVRIITYEGLMLSVLGIPLGVGLGIGLGYAAYRAVLSTGVADYYLTPSKAAELVHFSVNPLLLLIGVVTGAMWVFFSAYGTGVRVIKMSPVQAISQRSNTVKKVRKTSLFGKLFGWTGEISSRNNMRQPKRFIISVVSLTVSLTLFASVSTVVSIGESAITDALGAFGWEFEFEAGTGSRYNPDYGMFAYKEGIERIKESGMFTEPMIFHSNYLLTVPDNAETGYNNTYSVVYVNKPLYEYIFKNIYETEPPVSYEELTETNSYILNDIYGTLNKTGQTQSGEFTVIKRDFVSTYNGKDSINPEYLDEFTEESYISNGETYIFYLYDKKYDYTMKIAGYVNNTNNSEKASFLGVDFIGTMDSYENGEYMLTNPELKILKNLTTNAYIGCDLINPDDYLKAKEFNEENLDVFVSSGFKDNFENARQMKSLLSAAGAIANALNIMFALIAVISMVNILSTGIINRRGELAAMQCVGMTEKQLNKMMFLECLQYIFVSGIASIIVCEALAGLTLLFAVSSGVGIDAVTEIFGNLFDIFTMPPLRIFIAIIPAFAAALAASFIPLYGIKKRSLVDQIRSVE